jgi:hypothetical protein
MNMRKWQYEAVSVHGGKRKFRGVVEAESGEYAILDLMKRKLYPISIREMSHNDQIVANRLTNYKRIKNALTPGMNITVKTPTSAPKSRMTVDVLVIIGWILAIAGFLWVASR